LCVYRKTEEKDLKVNAFMCEREGREITKPQNKTWKPTTREMEL